MLLDDANFEHAIRNGRVVVWWTASNAPCRAFDTILSDVGRRHPGVRLARVDTDVEPDLADRCGISVIPTLMAFRNGTLLLVRTGFFIAEALDALLRAVERHA